MTKKKKPSKGSSNIARNKKARHDYYIEQTFEAGVALEGWEVKSIRDGKVNLVDSYVTMKNGEAWLLGTHITPLLSASTHIIPDPIRTRKLLLHRRELGKIHDALTKEGLTCVALALFWKGPLVKCEIALARGKKMHDKRATEKDRDWSREKQRTVRHDQR